MYSFCAADIATAYAAALSSPVDADDDPAVDSDSLLDVVYSRPSSLYTSVPGAAAAAETAAAAAAETAAAPNIAAAAGKKSGKS